MVSDNDNVIGPSAGAARPQGKPGQPGLPLVPGRLGRESPLGSSPDATSQWPWLDGVLARLAELGLNGRAFDLDGRALGVGPPPGPFSRLLWQNPKFAHACGQIKPPSPRAGRQPAPKSHSGAACRPGGGSPEATEDDGAAQMGYHCVPGYTCVHVPILRRRRRLGMIVVSFASRDYFRESADSEELAQFCQTYQMDRTALVRAAEQEARFYSTQASIVQQIARSLVEQTLERHVARNELAELSENLTSTYEELSLVYKIAAGMAVTEKPEDYLRNTGSELLEVMGVESLAMRYFRPDQPLISEHISIGAELTSPSAEQMMWDELLTRFETRPEAIVDNLPGGTAECLVPTAEGQALKLQSACGFADSIVKTQAESSVGAKGQATAVPTSSSGTRHSTLNNSPGHLTLDTRHLKKVRRLAAVPMIRNGRLIGAIVAMNKADGDFDSTDVKLMKSVADEEAVFLENAYLYEDLQQLLMGMLRALTSSIDAKDPYTCGHSERVALIARKIAQSAGLDEHAVGRVYLAGLLHDIGKIGVPEAVLVKPGRLTPDEFATMRKHPEIGARILAGIKQVEDLVAGVLFHHERMDGRGYPQGLAGGNIPLFGRIVGLADCFDAMTSNRTYRRALPLEVTLTEIRRFAGTQFDPRLVEAFLKLDPAELLRQTRSSDPGSLDPLKLAVAGEFKSSG